MDDTANQSNIGKSTSRRTIWQIAVLALCYAVASKAAHLLAIPPGYAAPIWPAAGISLGLMLLWGNRVWPGVFLGSALIKIWASWSANDLDNVPELLGLASAIGLGATLQCLLGVTLVKRVIGWPNEFIQDRIILLFLVLIGPVACLISPLVGVSALTAAGKLSPDEYLINAWTWYVGDAIGTCLFAPLVLILFAQPRQSWRPRLLMVAVPMAATFTLVVVLFIATSQTEQQRIERRQTDIALNVHQAIEDDIKAYVETCSSIADLFASSDRVEREEFATFTKRLLSKHQAIQAVEFVPWVRDDQRGDFEQAARTDGLKDFQFKERKGNQLLRADVREAYAPVLYAEPIAQNEAAIGFDLASNPARRSALDQARDTGMTVATGRIRLVQAKGDQFGFLVFHPLYHNNRPTDTLELRRANLLGFTVGVFQIDDLINDALKKAGVAKPWIQLIDISVKSHEQLLYSNMPESKDLPKRSVDDQYSRALSVAGRIWQFTYTPMPSETGGANPLTPWYVLAGGLMLVTLLSALLFVLGGRTAAIQSEVDAKTAAIRSANALLEDTISKLARSNEELDDFAYIASHDLKEPLRGLSNYASFLLEDYEDCVDGEGKKMLQRLPVLTKKMDTLIDSLLQFSRVGRVDLAYAETDLNQVLAEVIDTLQIRLDEEGVEIRLPRQLPVIHCDSVRIAEVFRNLITNAMKYNDKPARWIEIGFFAPGEDPLATNEQYLFFVRDNGIGIKENHLDKLFRMFRRLHGEGEYGGGTGVGLTIVKKIVERHHGRIWAESKFGEGTTFKFSLRKAESA